MRPRHPRCSVRCTNALGHRCWRRYMSATNTSTSSTMSTRKARLERGAGCRCSRFPGLTTCSPLAERPPPTCTAFPGVLGSLDDPLTVSILSNIRLEATATPRLSPGVGLQSIRLSHTSRRNLKVAWVKFNTNEPAARVGASNAGSPASHREV